MGGPPVFGDMISELMKMTGGDPATDARIVEDMKDVEATVEWHSLIDPDGIEHRIKRTRYGNAPSDAPLVSCTVDEFQRDLAEGAARAGG